jgi:hypothetical protein
MKMEDALQHLLRWVGRVAGILGLLICAVAIGARLSGQFWVIGIQTGTLLQAGNTLILAGCLGYLALLARNR